MYWFAFFSIVEEEFEEIDDDITDEEFNEKESEEGSLKESFLNVQLVHYGRHVQTSFSRFELLLRIIQP